MAKTFDTISKTLSKVGSIVNMTLDNALSKAKDSTTYKYTVPRKSVVLDLDIMTGFSGLYRDRGSLVSFEMLKQISERDMIVAAIIGKLCNRVAAFAQPQRNKYTLGFVVRPNPHVDVEKVEELDETDLSNVPGDGVLTSEQKKEIGTLVSFIMKTGIDSEERPASDRMSFETFLRLITKDRLVYNQIGIECIPTRDEESIAYFTPVSGGSLRYATADIKSKIADPKSVVHQSLISMLTDSEQKKRLDRINETKTEDIAYVQVNRGQICALFTDDDLIYRQGIPSIELSSNGYSPGELELLINSVANHRIAESHNEAFFRFGYANNGILNIKSELTEEDVQGLKRQFERQYQGTRNAFKMPIMSSKDGIEWIQTGPSNKDMEWAGWMEYLIKIITAVYGISPAEINFDIARGDANSLGDGGARNEVMLRDTRNSMLRPLLRWIESIINDEVLPRFDQDLASKYVFEFVGLEHEDKDAELDRIKKQVTSYRTVNEIRAEEGLENIKDGDVVLDSIFLQYRQLRLQNEQQQGGGQGGDEPPNGDEPQESSEEDVPFEDIDVEDLFPEKEEDTSAKSTNSNSYSNISENNNDNPEPITKVIDDFIFDISKGEVKKSKPKSDSKLLKVEWYAK